MIAAMVSFAKVIKDDEAFMATQKDSSDEKHM